MLGRAHFSQKELQNLNQRQIKDKLLEKGIDWKELPRRCKYGTSIYNNKIKNVVYIKNHEFVKKLLEPDP
jgi:hypothetical protein